MTQPKPHAWIRTLPLWHLLFAITLGTTLIITLSNVTNFEQAIMPLLFSLLLVKLHNKGMRSNAPSP